MKGTIHGFRLILVGDLHEQPMLQFNVKPFVLMAKDWSSGVSLSRQDKVREIDTRNLAPGVSRARNADQLLESCKFALGTLYDLLHIQVIEPADLVLLVIDPWKFTLSVILVN
jgi:hypothetical protein